MRLAAQRGVEQVGRDLRVEGDAGSGVVAPPAMFATSEWLDLVADDPRLRPEQQIAEPAHRLVALGDQHAPVRRRPGPEPGACPAAAAGRPSAEPRRSRRDRRATREASAASSAVASKRSRSAGPPRPLAAPRPDRIGPAGAPAAGRARRSARTARDRRARSRRRPAPRRLEVHRELQIVALAHAGRASLIAAPARRRRGRILRRAHPRRRYAALHRAERLGRVHCRLARERRQPVDQRAELVLAKEPDHLGAVVVAEARGLQIERDRQVAD